MRSWSSQIPLSQNWPTSDKINNNVNSSFYKTHLYEKFKIKTKLED